MNPSFELTPPHNWCDRRCERCPLAPSCPIPAAPPRDLVEILEEACESLEEVCRRDGIDLEAPIELPRPSVERLVLERAAHEWVAATVPLDLHVRDLRWRTIFIAGKVARLAALSDPPDEEVWASDAIMNLLVLEHVLDCLRADVDDAPPSAPRTLVARFRERDDALRRLLAPLLGTISAADRAILAALVAAQRAPSPFASTDASPVPGGARP